MIRFIFLFLSLAPIEAYCLTAEKVFEIASPSVVVVKIFDANQKPLGLGSGVTVSKGKVITNCHVAEAQSDVVLFIEENGASHKAILQKHLEEYDLCLLAVENLNTPVATIGKSDDLRIGQKVYAIGTPSGFDLTLTDGLISSLRKFSFSKIIQTSAAISPGSSGGGLFNDQGKLIGITTFKIEGSEGINFAHVADHIVDLIKISSMPSFVDELNKPINNIEKLTPLPRLFSNKVEANRWLSEMSNRLEQKIPDKHFRLDFLKAVHYESTRAGLDPHLVLSLIEVVSDFKKYSVTEKGEQGFMGVDPKWVREIGTLDQNLFHTRTNLRYGCTILKYYLDEEHGDLFLALGRYDGSRGNPKFPNKVTSTLKSNWNYKN